ncbi:MAG: alpha/beta hydrolase [Wolbachia endosymbiont of Tyrophagus putrescentiae]|nr:alpha/beta hydrolase [Wolbachia endosymbiont of Tyrophagus putrescentiae]
MRYITKAKKLEGYAHKYPAAFQHYISYCIASFAFLAASILAPIAVLYATSVTLAGAGLASLACIFLSVLFIMIPFKHRNQGLFKDSIEHIDQRVKNEGVDPSKIILFGHSFGGATALEICKHFANNNIKLGGVVLTNTFSSLEQAIRNFPLLPQAKVLSLLPLGKLLKCLDLEFNLAGDIKKLHDGGKAVPITVINNVYDNMIPKSAQLLYKIEHLKSVKAIEMKCSSYDYHNYVLDSVELAEEIVCIEWSIRKMMLEEIKLTQSRILLS